MQRLGRFDHGRYNIYMCDHTFASLPPCNSGDSFDCAAFRMFWLMFFHYFGHASLSRSRLFRRCLPTSCRSLSRKVGSVFRDRPRQPATSADVKYWSMASCAGASRGMRSTGQVVLQTTPSSDGRQAHWFART